ncbi:EpsG family protein [Algibacter miyuki]|uniref:EpsG family protein n=1 Tax=Algibacter miyuki TaxID=1306933 RepID=A0ABV5GYG0_9FLAO|nr:EpsG family protein [Algibacter miyuki]MDN3667153.1 EpsG family protein [Algibacter miyuki]
MRFLFEHFTTSDYSTIFSWGLFLFILIGSLNLRYVETNTNKYLRTDRNLLIIFVVFIIFLFGTRGFKIGTDTYNYRVFYFNPGIRISNVYEFFSFFETDILFEILIYFAFMFKDFTVFLVIVATIMNAMLYVFVRKYTNYGRNGSSLLLFLLIACNFVFFTHQTNTIRNGLAIPYIFFGIYYLMIKKTNYTLLFFLLAFLSHRTAIIPIACVFFAIKSKNIDLKYFIALYALGILAAAAGFGFDKLTFLASMGGDDLERLSSVGETTYRVGFRPDFVLYNTIFLVLAIKFSPKKSPQDLFYLKYYILASIIFFFNFNIPYSDRIGGYSWIAIPLLFFSIINSSFPKKKLQMATLFTFFIFFLNFVLLPLLTSGLSLKKRDFTNNYQYEIKQEFKELNFKHNTHSSVLTFKI